MRFLIILGLIILGYLLFVKPPQPSVAPSGTPAATASATQTPKEPSMIKAPIDRARKALEATEKRNADGF